MKCSLFLLFLSLTSGLAVESNLFKMDFEQAAIDQLPDKMIVLDGAFTVKADGTNKVLELPGAPLDTFGVLFGPAQTDGAAVAARIFGSGKGRRFPAFAVGVSGAGGYKLQVSPAKRSLEIIKGDTSLTNANYTWKSETWTCLKIELRKAGEKQWLVRGKAWTDGEKEPTGWQIEYQDDEKPPGGPSSVWGNPFSGQPIRFDDLIVTKLE